MQCSGSCISPEKQQRRKTTTRKVSRRTVQCSKPVNSDILVVSWFFLNGLSGLQVVDWEILYPFLPLSFTWRHFSFLHFPLLLKSFASRNCIPLLVSFLWYSSINYHICYLPYVKKYIRYSEFLEMWPYVRTPLTSASQRKWVNLPSLRRTSSHSTSGLPNCPNKHYSGLKFK